MAICEAFLKGSCKAGGFCRKEHSRPAVNADGQPRSRNASLENNKVFISKPAPPTVLGKRPAPGSATVPTTRTNASKPSENAFDPPTGPRNNTHPPRGSSSSSMPPPPRPVSSSSNITSGPMPSTEDTVFDNNHALAPAALEMMIGQPFHELHRGTWLLVRDDFSDIQKLLADAFLLRKHDNRECNGPDRAKLGNVNGRDIKGEWRMFVLSAARQRLLPFEPDTEGLNKLIQETAFDEAREMDPSQVKTRYNDAQMPLQMRIFAGQVFGYDLPNRSVSPEQWADLLKFEEWMWAGHGFQWSAIFGQL